MTTGTVKWFNTTKGFGFIAPDDGGNDVFVHITALEKAGLRSLSDGQKVNFDLEENRGKQAATNISVVDDA
ncbi:MAG: cold-shock protein [Robiginitomaculum sp.]|nr:MAG: cold-shock protein [Robiginitomaculum sp.]